MEKRRRRKGWLRKFCFENYTLLFPLIFQHVMPNWELEYFNHFTLTPFLLQMAKYILGVLQHNLITYNRWDFWQHICNSLRNYGRFHSLSRSGFIRSAATDCKDKVNSMRKFPRCVYRDICIFAPSLYLQE